jgi:alkanesulfonate monooxygenase SsuD/methylene tetrahydromethanopterin reductase-like flavin-dependent oxidoreductase (luciferase family)
LHDTVWFEIQGKPAVSIASTEFVDAAETQARALGMNDARRVFVAHPIQDATDDEMRAKADAVIDQVIEALTQND